MTNVKKASLGKLLTKAINNVYCHQYYYYCYISECVEIRDIQEFLAVPRPARAISGILDCIVVDLFLLLLLLLEVYAVVRCCGRRGITTFGLIQIFFAPPCIVQRHCICCVRTLQIAERLQC